MRIYTKTGDQGYTRLANGEKIFKSDARVDLYGTADELNSHIGLALSFLGKNLPDLKNQLSIQQSLLFELGSELAGYYKNRDASVIVDSDIASLEGWIDGFTSEIPEMKSFILPGGETASSQLHVCRTVCRRLERKMAAIIETKSHLIFDKALIYVNRLSDYLFVAARFVNFKASVNDIPWKSREK